MLTHCVMRGKSATGAECYCGNKFNVPQPAKSNGCNMACSGKTDETCGGNYAINVYEFTCSGI